LIYSPANDKLYLLLSERFFTGALWINLASSIHKITPNVVGSVQGQMVQFNGNDVFGHVHMSMAADNLYLIGLDAVLNNPYVWGIQKLNLDFSELNLWKIEKYETSWSNYEFLVIENGNYILLGGVERDKSIYDYTETLKVDRIYVNILEYNEDNDIYVQISDYYYGNGNGHSSLRGLEYYNQQIWIAGSTESFVPGSINGFLAKFSNVLDGGSSETDIIQDLRDFFTYGGNWLGIGIIIAITFILTALIFRPRKKRGKKK